MGRRELILQELLEAMESGGDIERVIRRHSDSKSVLFQAIAMAIPIAIERLRSVVDEETSAQKLVDVLLPQIEELRSQIHNLQEQVTELKETHRRIDEAVKDNQSLLDKAASLERNGFSLGHLRQLQQKLEDLAIDRKSTVNNVTDFFFQLVDRLDNTVGLRVDVQRSEKRLSELSIEIRNKEAEVQSLANVAEARRIPLNALELLRAKGVKYEEIPRWQRLVQGSGVRLVDLNRNVKEYGSLKKAIAHLERNKRQLLDEDRDLTIKVQSLNQEQGQAWEELQELNTEMLGQAVRRDLLETKANELAPLVKLARAFSDPGLISTVPPETVGYLLSLTVFWLQETGRADLIVPFELASEAGWVFLIKRPSIKQVVMLVLGSLATTVQGPHLP